MLREAVESSDAGTQREATALLYLSAMVNEEIAVASLTTLALLLALDEQRSASSSRASWLRAVAIGVRGIVPRRLCVTD